MQDIAKYKRQIHDIPVVAITGSVGKTSTKDLIASVVSQEFDTLKTKGNYNNHIGLPLTLLELNNQQAAVVEMGMNHLGEISVLANIAKPTIAVITNIGTAHIGLLGSKQNILKAKLEILDGLEQDGLIILNNDDKLLNSALNEINHKVYTYGIENKSDLNAYNIKLNEQDSTFNIKINQKEYTINVPMAGKHFIYNALCAISVGLNLNISIEKIINGIKNFKPSKLRMNIIETKENIKIINDTYNASYDSVKSVLEVLKNMKARRKIAVLGDVLELGEHAKKLHEQIGIQVVKNQIDILMTLGQNSKFIANKAVESGMKEENVFSFDEKEELISKIKQISNQDDIILFKASRGMELDKVVENITKGDKK